MCVCLKDYHNISSIILYNQSCVLTFKISILIFLLQIHLKLILGGGEVIVCRDLNCDILHVIMASLPMSH